MCPCACERENGCASTCACIIQGLWVCTYGYAYACMCMFVFCVRNFSAHKVTVHTCVAMCMRACIWVCKYMCKHHTCGNMGMHMHACFFACAHICFFGGGDDALGAISSITGAVDVAMCMRACIWVCQYMCMHHTGGILGRHMHACFFWRAHTFAFVGGGTDACSISSITGAVGSCT